jgi:hypothetical protein
MEGTPSRSRQTVRRIPGAADGRVRHPRPPGQSTRRRPTPCMGGANIRNPDDLTDPACTTTGANFREPAASSAVLPGVPSLLRPAASVRRFRG